MEEIYQMKTSISLSKYLFSLSSIILIVVFYWIFSTIQNDAWFYPSWSEICGGIGKIITSGEKMSYFGYSFLRILFTILLSFISAVIVAFFYVIFEASFHFFKPLILIMKTAPMAILSVYLFIIVGSKIASFIITYLFITPVFVEGLINAIKNIPIEIINELRITPCPMYKKFIKVYFPLIFPYVAMTFFQTIGLSIKVMMMGEYICQTPKSIGKYIYLLKTEYNCTMLLSILIIVVVFVAIIEGVISILSKRYFTK